ncbi:hypothetical protein SASPL_104288 [Salvia splendens]|uniref:Pentatricopeptide repeat domain-containing protein 1 n=1 Tax=Salvia splendens TaxID=180675 RepID=A0A8X9A8Y1_SALSN|nr:hypothetical protein SASPL_104288 [Salvia splendens]
MVNLSRQLAAGAPALVRRLSTEVRAAAAPQQEDRLYRRLSALGRNPGMVARTINEYILGGEPSEKLSSRGVSTNSANINDIATLSRCIMEWIELRKFNFNHCNYATRLDLTAKAKGIAAAEEYFNSLSPSKVVHCVYGSLLNCYCNEKMADRALDIFAKMVEQSMVVKSLPFNNLMSMYCRLGQYEKVLILGEEMKKGNIKPDTCTYNLLMNSHANLNDIEGAERVFEDMKLENGKQCNWTSYSNLANIYIKVGYQEKAKLALQNVEKEMDSHDREAYHFLISLYAGALGNLGDIVGMTKCYKEWEAVCSSYNLKLAVAVIRAYLRHDMGEEAETVLEIRPALQHMETATSIAHENKWQPRSETIDKFLNYFKQESDVSLAEEFYHLMKRVNCVDSRLYESLIETYKASGEAMLNMRARMEADGVELSSDIEQLLPSP